MNFSLQNYSFNKKYVKIFFIAFALLSLILITDSFAADNDDAITKTLCNVIGKLTGGIGKTIATIAIIVLGIGLFLGKLSWAVAVATAIGIGLIFGASGMVGWIGSGVGTGTDADTDVCATSTDTTT